MDTTIAGLKRKASNLDEEQDSDVVGLGGRPLQPRPFDPHDDEDSKFEPDPAAKSNPTPLDGTDQIDDGIHWLNRKRGLYGKAVCAERR